MKQVPAIPEWMKDLPNHSTIGNLEICEIFGIHKSSVSRAVDRGTLPPSFSISRESGPGHIKYKWRLGDVRKFVKKILSEQSS